MHVEVEWDEWNQNYEVRLWGDPPPQGGGVENAEIGTFATHRSALAHAAIVARIVGCTVKDAGVCPRAEK
jgi:hypothetical protein